VPPPTLGVVRSALARWLGAAGDVESRSLSGWVRLGPAGSGWVRLGPVRRSRRPVKGLASRIGNWARHPVSAHPDGEHGQWDARRWPLRGGRGLSLVGAGSSVPEDLAVDEGAGELVAVHNRMVPAAK